MTEITDIAVIVVAAGRGSRAGEGLPKQYRKLRGKTVLRRTLEAFAGYRVLTVIHPDDLTLFEQSARGLDVMAPVHGGATRQESVLNGLEALPHDASVVLVHDAARCFVTPGLIAAVAAKVRETGDGALPVLPVTDTIKRGASGMVADTVPRADLFAAQTPQGFPFSALLDLHRRFKGEEMTDDAALFEAAGRTVHLVPGDPANIKLTHPEDFAMSFEPRTGTGFDVHRFEPGDYVWLCGVKVPHTAKLKGHSDADVGIHALVDAILGALSAGDIGDHFPPSDPKWKGAASDLFLAHARDLVTARGGRIAHVDVTLICEAPKLMNWKPAMKARLADILGIDPDRVSVKATTTEKLGFTGRGEGIAAQAVATVMVPGV